MPTEVLDDEARARLAEEKARAGLDVTAEERRLLAKLWAPNSCSVDGLLASFKREREQREKVVLATAEEKRKAEAEAAAVRQRQARTDAALRKTAAAVRDALHARLGPTFTKATGHRLAVEMGGGVPVPRHGAYDAPLVVVVGAPRADSESFSTGGEWTNVARAWVPLALRHPDTATLALLLEPRRGPSPLLSAIEDSHTDWWFDGVHFPALGQAVTFHLSSPRLRVDRTLRERNERVNGEMKRFHEAAAEIGVALVGG